MYFLFDLMTCSLVYQYMYYVLFLPKNLFRNANFMTLEIAVNMIGTKHAIYDT